MTAGPFIRINFKSFNEFHLHIAAANENKGSAGGQQLGQRLCGWSKSTFALSIRYGKSCLNMFRTRPDMFQS